jgi:hypothetical protein
MSEPSIPLRDPVIAFESFGVPVALTTNEPASMDDLRSLVPPHATQCPPDAVQHRLLLRRTAGGAYDVRYEIRGGETLSEHDPLAWVATTVNRPFALAMVDSYVHNTVALHAPQHVFVQGAVMAHGGRALVMPGKPLTGRTTLVEALREAGLQYISDEYAVLDQDGRVHPYARPLNGRPVDVPVEPLPVGAVFVTSYWPDARWEPVRRSAGEGLLAVMAHVVGGQERPDLTLTAIKNALASASLIVESRRGEADDVVRPLLDELGDPQSL